MRKFIGKFGLVIAALIPGVRAMSQAPIVVVTPPGACTTGNLTATSSIQPLSIAWTGPSSGTVNATWGANGTKIAGNSLGSGLNQLDNPNGLFVDASGNVFVADFNNNRVIKFSFPYNPANNGTVVAGTGTAGSTNTQLNGPTAVYVDGSGNIFVCDQGNNRVMEWSSPYTSGTCVAGGNGFASGNTALAAPFGLYLDGSGNLFVGDKSNNRVQKFTAAQIASAVAGQTSASVAGTTVLGGNGAGAGTNQLNFPSGVFVDASGNLYVADYNNNRIEKITAAQIASATAGQTSSVATATTSAGGNGSGTAANQLNHPNGVYLDCANNIYVADYSNNRVQQWLSGAGSGTTIAGSAAGTSGSTASLLNLPSDVVVDASGNLFVTDYNNSRVQEFTPTIVSTFAYTLPGTYTATATTFTCATGSGSALTTTSPVITTQPTAQIVCAGASATFNVVATGTTLTYHWFENGSATPLVDGGIYSGTQTATLVINPATAPMNGNTYSVQVTGACPGTATSSTVTLTVNSAASIIGSPPTTQTTCVGSNTSISVFATGTSLTYQWQVNPPSGFGNVPLNINYSGQTSTTLSILNAPAGFNGNVYRVIVNSTACPATVTSTSTTLTVNPLPVINAPQPQPVIVCSGGNATYVVSASGTGLSYQWQYSTTGSGGPWINQTNITPFTGANTPTLNLVGLTTASNGYYFQCVVTSSAGCVATTIPALLTVNPIPTITPGTISPICSGITSVLLNYTGVSGIPTTYTINGWSGGTFATVTAAPFTNPNPITIAVPAATTANTYTANFFVTNAGGCSSPGQNISITVNALPTITLGTNPSECFNASNTSVNLPYSAVTGLSPYTYSITWSSALATVTNATLASAPGNINIPVPGGTPAGTYTGNLTVMDANGCTSNPASAISVTINPLPTITFSNGSTVSVCSGNTVGTLPYSATTATQYSITWNGAAPGQGFTPVGTSPLAAGPSQISFSIPGLATPATYTGNLILTDANSCSNTFTITVVINPNPTITVTNASQQICFGTASVNFNYSTTTNNPVTDSITWGPSASAAGFTSSASATALPGAPGPGSIPVIVPGTATFSPPVYTGTLTVMTAAGCSVNTALSITINPIPSITPGTVAPGVNSFICVGSTPAVVNYSGAFASPNQYSVTAWAPTTPGTFATSSNQTLLPGSFNIAIPPTATPRLDTAYVTVTNSVTGCTSPAIPVVVQVQGVPFISLHANPTSCQGVTNDTLGYTITNINPINNPINYSITYAGAPGNGFANVGTTPLTASPLPITVPAAAPANVYNGTITVINAAGCSTPYPFTVTVNPTPTITMTSPQSVCSLVTNVVYPYTTTGDGTSATDSIVWDPLFAVPQGFTNATGSLPTLPSGSLNIAVPANPSPNSYNGTMYTTSQFGCTSTGSAFTVNILPLPTISLGLVNPVCFNASAQVAPMSYTATGVPAPNKYSITWSSGPFVPVVNATLSGGIINLAVPAATPPATYTGTLTVSNTNCTSLSTTFTITVNPLPTITLVNNALAVCYNASTAQSVNLQYSNVTGTGPYTYGITWTSGPLATVPPGTSLTTPAPGPIVINVPAGAGSATVATVCNGLLTVKDANGCSTSPTVAFSITINPLPTITLGANPIVCSGATSANLPYTATTNTPNQYSITWSPAASFAGFTNVVNASPLSSPISLVVPAAAPAAVYSGNILTVTNSTTGCTSNNNTFSITLDQKPAKPVVSPSPDTVCAGSNLIVVALTSTPGTPSILYNWVGPNSIYFTSPQPSTKLTGVNDTLPLTNPLAIVQESGIYKVTASISYGALACVSDTAFDTVYVIPAPPVPVPTSNSPICVGGTILLHAGVTLGPGLTLSWAGPGPFGPTNQTTTDTFIANAQTNNTGDFIVYTSVTQGSYTCNSIAPTTTVVVEPLPNNPTSSIDLQNHSITVCQNAPIFVQGFLNGAGNLQWSALQGGNCYGVNQPFQNLSVPNAQFCDSGLYVLNAYIPYFVQGVNLKCFSATPDTVDVHINALPVAPSLATVNSPICLGDILHFHTANVPALGVAYSYLWSDSTGFAFLSGPQPGADVFVPNAVYADSGWYNVHTTYTNNGVVCQSVGDLSVHVTTKPLPVTPNAQQVTPLCVGDTLRVIVVDTQHNVTFIWIPINPDSCYQCEPPGSPQGVNHLDTVTTLTLTVNHSLLIDSGLYNIYAVLNGCKSALPGSTQVTVKPRPNTPGDSSNSPICQGAVLHLYSYDTVSNPPGPPTLQGGLNYTWTGPNGYNSTSQNPNIAVTPLADAGAYCVYASFNGCSSVLPACTQVSVNPIPANPLASNNAPICSGAPNVLTLCADSTTPGISYLWSGPISLTTYNPTTRCINIPSPTAAMTGIYSVYAVLKYPYVKNGNNDTLSCNSLVPGITTVTVNTTPGPPAVSNVTYCQFQPTVALTAVGSNLLWYTTAVGGVGTAIAPTPYDSLPGTTIWYVSQSSVNGCTSSRSSLSVTVLQQSQPPYIPNPTITYCQGDVATMINVVGVALQWYTTPTGGFGTFITPTPSTATPGTTVWYVTQTTNGCESQRLPVTIVVKQRPQPPVVNDVTYCQNAIAVPLTAIGQNLLWYTTAAGGFGASAGPTPVTTTPDTITYYVTESFNGCESYRAPQHVFVLYTPNAVIVPNQPYVCEDSVMSFKYFGSALPDASYDWGLPAGSFWDSGRGPGPIWVKFDSPGNQVITLIVSNGMCKSPLATYTVNVRPMPVQTIGSLHEVCQDDTMIVGLGSATPGVSLYTWDFDSTGAYLGNGIYDTGAEILSSAGPAGPFSIVWTVAGLHVIKVKALLDNCPSGWVVDTVNVHPLPDARISTVGIGIPCTNDSLQFSALIPTEENLYTWSPAIFFINGNNSAVVEGNVHYSSSIFLSVTTPYGCKATDSLYVQTDSCCKVAFPNAFTPNGDGLNDVFRPFLKEKGHHILKVFRIANRWGQTVFETTDEKHGWDGRLNGVDQDMDTYFWFIDYVCAFNNVRYQERGECYLVR